MGLMVDGPTLTAELLEYADAIDKDRGRRTGVTVTMREAADALAALLARAEAAEKALARTRGMLRDAMAFVDPEVAGDWKLWLDEIGVAGSSPVDSGVEGGAGTASRGRALLAGDSGGRLLDREASGASSSSSPAAEAETHVLTIRVDADTLDGGFVSSCVERPGVMSQGATVPEAVANLAEAIAGVDEAEAAKFGTSGAEAETSKDCICKPLRRDENGFEVFGNEDCPIHGAGGVSDSSEACGCGHPRSRHATDGISDCWDCSCYVYTPGSSDTGETA